VEAPGFRNLSQATSLHGGPGGSAEPSLEEKMADLTRTGLEAFSGSF
jgi:hypothetical protein